jgi:FkbM family methyltransferase
MTAAQRALDALIWRFIHVLIRTGGWPLPSKALVLLRDFANYALGAGSASLGVADSGERAMLERLSRLWNQKGEITVVDVGAHQGDFARAARSAFGDRARIHCFEPEPLSFQALEAALSADAGIECHQLALGAAPGTARIFSDEPGSTLASLHPETFSTANASMGYSAEVSVETLDRVARTMQLGRIDLLKIDVEGHEVAVLNGAHELLAKDAIGVVQFEFGERNLATRTYLRDFVNLLGLDYELFRLSPRGLTRFEYQPSCEVFLLETNYVAVRRPHPT